MQDILFVKVSQYFRLYAFYPLVFNPESTPVKANKMDHIICPLAGVYFGGQGVFAPLPPCQSCPPLKITKLIFKHCLPVLPLTLLAAAPPLFFKYPKFDPLPPFAKCLHTAPVLGNS